MTSIIKPMLLPEKVLSSGKYISKGDLNITHMNRTFQLPQNIQKVISKCLTQPYSTIFHCVMKNTGTKQISLHSMSHMTPLTQICFTQQSPGQCAFNTGQSNGYYETYSVCFFLFFFFFLKGFTLQNSWKR